MFYFLLNEFFVSEIIQKFVLGKFELKLNFDKKNTYHLLINWRFIN